MKIGQIIKCMKQNSIDYHDDVQEYVCTTQRAFSACLFLFFALHIIVINILDFANYKHLNTAVWISSLQMLLSFVGYLLFRYHFKVHKKHILTATYFNILQTTLLLELQYFLYDEYISYTVIICIVLSTSLTIIGHIRKYATIILLFSLLDIAATIIKNSEYIHSYQMHMYIIDSIFVALIAVGINFCFSRLKYQDFAAKHQIIYLSERDSLTGLLNRKSLEYAVQKYSNSGTLCAMILLDLDNFKTLNDTLGHYEGDNCLRAVSDELKGIFRHTDFVSRLGGDEFVAFMPDINIEYVTEITKLILQKVPQKYPYKNGEIAVTCSVGVAFSLAEDKDLYEKLYKAADHAMYTSKSKGKNSVTIYKDDFSSINY